GGAMALDVQGSGYGATSTAKGRVTWPQGNTPASFDLRGRARHVDLRHLPNTVDVPRTATDVNADYHIVGTGVAPGATSRVVVDLRFAPSSLAGAKIESGTATLALGERPVEYRTDVNVANLDLQQLGEQVKIPAIATDRFK